MYKDLGSMIITGSTGTGKTFLIQCYIDEVLNDKKKVIIVDPKMVEHHKYKKVEGVTYVGQIDMLDEVISLILNRDKSEKIYLFVDEYAEIKFNKDIHSKIKNLIKNKKELNLVIVLSSQLKTSFCNGMKSNIDTVVHLNRQYW